MLEWQDYVARLLSSKSSFDGIKLSFDDSDKSIGVPPIIKSSILMLDKMQERQGRFNILVFPERIQSIFIFTLVKLLYNISEGKIDHAYDPSSFVAGDRLKFGSVVAEFVAHAHEDQACREPHHDSECRVFPPVSTYQYQEKIEYFQTICGGKKRSRTDAKSHDSRGTISETVG